MPTITSTIGSNNRDFLTPQAWADSIPSDLVSIATRYNGVMYNDSEFTGAINIAARTTSPEYNINLYCAPGHSIADHLNGYDLPVNYDLTKGVGLKITKSSGDYAINIDAPHTRIYGLQVDYQFSGSRALRIGGISSVVSRCFMRARPNHATNNLVAMGVGRAEHSMFVYDSTISPNAAVQLNSGELYNVGIVKPIDKTKSGTAINGNSSANPKGTIKNCYVFGFATASAAASNFGTCSNNATDGTFMVGASADMVGLVYADEFIQPSMAVANPNWRLKSSSKMLDKGADLTSTLGSAADMFGYPQGRAWDIGPVGNLELAVALRIKTAPSVGYVGEASTAFVVELDGSFSGDVLVTPNDGGKGGTFVPTSATLSSANLTRSFTYTPAVEASIDITFTSDRSYTAATRKYQAAQEATTLSLTGVPLTGRAFKEITGLKVRANGVVEFPTTVTPRDDGEGIFTPTSGVLSQAVQELVFSYTGVSGGVKKLTLSNDGGLANPAAYSITLAKPIVAVPTLSDDYNIVKSIGTGKDFPDVGQFATWVKTLDFTTLKKNVIGEVYNDMSLASYTVLNTNVADTGGYLIYLQPVPGLSAADYDPLGLYDYGTEGIELDCSSFGIRFSSNVVVQDFRLKVNSNMVRLSHASWGGKGGTIRRNRVLVRTSEAAFHSGEYSVHGEFYDNLFVRDSGTGAAIITNICKASRNTFVLRGTGSYNGAVINTTSSNVHAASLVEDNVFINAGPVPIGNAEIFPAGKLYNNVTNQALTTPVAGILAVTNADLVNSTENDYRPKTGGALQGKGSINSIGVLDNRKNDRGGIPDIGSVQGAVVVSLSKVTITSVEVSGQDVIVSGTTTNNPTSGYAYLEADTEPYGASTIGPTPVTLGNGTFTVTWPDVSAGNYKIPKVVLTNAGGQSRLQSGGNPVVIVDVVAELIEGETPSPTGGAPVVAFDKIWFDNDYLSIRGSLDSQGDAKATLKVIVSKLPEGTEVVPTSTVNVITDKWGVQFGGMTGSFRVVATAVANGQTVVLESSVLKVIAYNGVVPIPL
jgi:hypothetical protein